MLLLTHYHGGITGKGERMALPSFTMKELLEAGTHFGHQINRWNPKMQTYLFGERNGIHIIDLQQTMPLLYSALRILKDVASGGGRILFVGTKRQAQNIIEEKAQQCGQYYVNHRWLGGTLTNWNTISNSITRLKKHEKTLSDQESGLTKKEMVNLTRQRDKLNLSLGGIKEMGGRPDALFVIDTNKEHIAVNEASVLKIPVIGILDSNCDPSKIDFPIPGNDDATRAISFYCRLAAEAILDGLQDSFKGAGKDLGQLEKGLSEKLKHSSTENKKLKDETLKAKTKKNLEKENENVLDKTEALKIFVKKNNKSVNQPIKDKKPLKDQQELVTKGDKIEPVSMNKTISKNEKKSGISKNNNQIDSSKTTSKKETNDESVQTYKKK